MGVVKGQGGGGGIRIPGDTEAERERERERETRNLRWRFLHDGWSDTLADGALKRQQQPFSPYPSLFKGPSVFNCPRNLNKWEGEREERREEHSLGREEYNPNRSRQNATIHDLIHSPPFPILRDSRHQLLVMFFKWIKVHTTLIVNCLIYRHLGFFPPTFQREKKPTKSSVQNAVPTVHDLIYPRYIFETWKTINSFWLWRLEKKTFFPRFSGFHDALWHLKFASIL